MKILLAEDEVTIAVTLEDALCDAGHEVRHVASTDEALSALETEQPDVVLTDIRMPGEGGMAVLRRSVELDSSRPVILITGYASVDQAVEAMSLGAAWYVQKPFSNDAVVELVRRFGRAQEIEVENRVLRERLARLESIEGMVGSSPAMQEVFDRLRTVAPTDATVLIEGESGTGKERAALALHRLSRRSEGAFIALSCAALPEGLLESELFGHEKGAFTDAHREKKGRVELADGGTLFLDDIDDMPLTVQVKLLRVLQERTFERVGSEKTRSVEMRVVAATKVPLRQAVRDGTFREDLFYRINVVPLPLPPLREREGDVGLLAQKLIERHFEPRTEGETAPTIARTTVQLMERYPWPGNVRELENAIQRALALRGENRELARDHLLPIDDRWRGATEVPETVAPLRDVLRAAEAVHLRKVLWEKLKDHGIDAEG